MAGMPMWEVYDTSYQIVRARSLDRAGAMLARDLLMSEHPQIVFNVRERRAISASMLQSIMEKGLYEVTIFYNKELTTYNVHKIVNYSTFLTHGGAAEPIKIYENFDGLKVVGYEIVAESKKEAIECLKNLWSKHPQYEEYLKAVESWRSSNLTQYVHFKVEQHKVYA